MSSNQPWRVGGRETGRRGRGRGRDGDDEERARHPKKVRQANLGDALTKSSSSSEQLPRYQGQPTSAAMSSNQPGRGWGGGRGGGRGQGGDADKGTSDSEKQRQPTLSEDAWPALPSSSSSGESARAQARTRPEIKTKLRTGADTADSKHGRLPEMKLRAVNLFPLSSPSDSITRSQGGIVTPNSQLGGNSAVIGSEQGGCLREAKHVQHPNNTSSSSPANTTRFTTRREQKIMCQQPAPSSGSDGTPPSNQSVKSGNSSGNSSGKKLSYIGIVEKGSDPEKNTRLSGKLLMFLNNFIEDGETFPYYIAELAAIKLRSPFNLTIQFRHMIKYDVELAFQTWKYQENMQDWMLPAFCDFLNVQKYGTQKDIMSKARLTLRGFPSSMRKVTDVLKNATYSLELLGGLSRCCEARAEGKLVVHLFFSSVFARHSKDESWDGNYSVSDMWLLDNAELHICRPCVTATGNSRLRDVQKGGEELLPYFKGPDGYPAYFAQLEEDIQETNINQLKEAWCVEYFTFHMCSLPSMTRRSFELSLHYINRNIIIEVDIVFRRLATGQVTNWQQYIENSDCEPLKAVLHYVDRATGQKVKYEANIGGLVKYKRHFLEHVLFGQIYDVNEVELFGAHKFSEHLPRTVKLLLQHKKMAVCFGAAWSSLKSAHFDARDTPVK